MKFIPSILFLNQCTAALRGITVHGICPAPSKLAELIRSKCVIMTAQEYNEKTVRIRGEAPHEQASRPEVSNNFITANEDRGVYQL